MQIDFNSVKKILVVRNDRFGEFLLNIPAFRALKETFINARLIVIVNPYIRELAEGMSLIDEIIEWGREKHTILEKLRLINLLIRKDIDVAVMLNPSREFNIITRLANIPVRVGYNRKCGFLLTHKTEDKKYLGNKHEIEYNLELVSLIGVKTKDKTLSLIINNDINNLLKDFDIRYDTDLVALHPWTSDPIKQWPKERFFKLAERLIKEYHIKVIIVGGKEELVKNLKLFSKSTPDLINLTGRTTLRQLAAILKKCKLLISGDSGPVHLSCAVSTPVIAIFRSDMPEKCSRRWGPCFKGSIVIEKDNLDDISVDEVFDRVKQVLSG